MKSIEGLQRAINFLIAVPTLIPNPTPAALPPAIDYEALARFGAANGYTFAEEDIAEAFRVFMRMRSVRQPRTIFDGGSATKST